MLATMVGGAAALVAPVPLARACSPAAATCLRVASPVIAAASAAALPSDDSHASSHGALEGVARAAGRWWEPLRAALRWCWLRLLAILGWLGLGRAAPTVGFALPFGCVMLEMRLVSGTATRDFEPPSKLLQHFGYSSSPFYTTLPRRRLAAASGGEGDGKGGSEGGGAGASLQAAAASARVGGGGVRWLQRGAGAAPRHPLDLASDEARLEFLQASTRGRPCSSSTVTAQRRPTTAATRPTVTSSAPCDTSPL